SQAFARWWRRPGTTSSSRSRYSQTATGGRVRPKKRFRFAHSGCKRCAETSAALLACKGRAALLPEARHPLLFVGSRRDKTARESVDRLFATFANRGVENETRRLHRARRQSRDSRGNF